MTIKYHTREEYLNAFVVSARPHFDRIGQSLPERIRVSVGFTSKGSRGNVIGETWDDSASSDGYFEIFIKPTIADAAAIATTLTLQLCHAAVGISEGYGNQYKACTAALGFTGTTRNPKASSNFFMWALPVLDELGEMPYGALKGDTTPKQKTNLLKLQCTQCGWLARVSRKHIDPHPTLECPLPECGGTLALAD